VKAFLIDPEAETITEVDVPGDITAWRQLLGCADITLGALPLGSSPNGEVFDMLFVDADTLEDTTTIRKSGSCYGIITSRHCRSRPTAALWWPAPTWTASPRLW
jgi:hypothetical protein